MSASPVWHPFTQHGVEPPALKITRTDGAYLETPEGRHILDGISSWWVTTHGHSHPKIMAAIRDAASHMDQVIFAGFTHSYAENLAHALVALTPDGLNHVFYSDSGSTAVEVALKMALGFFANQGRARQRIIVMEHSYHGDTIGAMSVGARGVFNAPYAPLLFDVARIPFPVAGAEQKTLAALEELTQDGETAALIVEPLVSGAGGMVMYPPAILRAMADIVARTQTLLIVDEVMTGWGRTGTLFACEQAGVSPDILCTSKGLTGGAIPLAATLAKDPIYKAHLSKDRSKAFFHSSSYTANPIACAAACANLEIWNTEPVGMRILNLCTWQEEELAALAKLDGFDNPRRTGTIAAIDLRVEDAGYMADIGLRLRAFFLGRNILLRPLGNVLYVMPPYCITREELRTVYQALADCRTLLA